jgi:hypothetical protein
MIFTRVAPLVFLTLLAGPSPQAPTLTISVSSDPASASAPFRVIANGGTVVSGERSYRAAADTLRLAGSAELTSQDPVFVATFIADAPGGHLQALVRENGTLTMSGIGETIVVIRTPQGAQLQAMGRPAELRRAP